MQCIPAVQDAVASALLTLGDGNWKMGEGLQVSKGPKLGEGDEGIILEHFLCKIPLLENPTKYLIKCSRIQTTL